VAVTQLAPRGGEHGLVLLLGTLIMPRRGQRDGMVGPGVQGVRVVVAEHLQLCVEYGAELGLGLGVQPSPGQHLSEVVTGVQGLRMRIAEHPPLDVAHCPEFGLGLLMQLPVEEHIGEVVADIEAGSYNPRLASRSARLRRLSSVWG